MNFIDIIPRIVSGFEIKRGSLVLLHFWGENSDLDILDKFAIEIAKIGAIPVRWQQSRELLKNYFTEVSTDNLEFSDKFYEIFRISDVVIDIFMYGPAPHKNFPKDKLHLYSDYMRKLFKNLSINKELFIQVRVPTIENAAREGIEYELYKNAMYNALNIDYSKLKNECNNLIKRLSGKNKVNIFTEDNRKLTFELGNRQWFKDDGSGDIPCGEIGIAPIEESAEGEILIPKIILEGKIYNNVSLEFNNGKLIKCSEKEILKYIRSFHGDCDIMAELGIGLNENVTELIGCPLIDEKCKGTAHIAVGMNNLFGGKNDSPLHIDFVFTPTKIEVDGEVIMKGKKLLIYCL